MNEKQEQICELLQKGHTYAQIQEALHVSPKVISAIKKEYFPSWKSNNNSTSRDHFQDVPATSLNNDPVIPQQRVQTETKRPIEQKHKNFNAMINNLDYFDEEDDDLLAAKIEMEKFKLELAHKLEMEKLRFQREDREREMNLKEKELQLKRDEIANMAKTREDEKKLLIFRVKKMTETCEDGEYSYNEAQELLSDTKKLLSDCEQFCFLTGIKFTGTESHTIISAAISALTEFLEEFEDDDETMELEFGGSFRRIVSRMKFQEF